MSLSNNLKEDYEHKFRLAERMIEENYTSIMLADAKSSFIIVVCGTIIGLFVSFIDKLFDLIRPLDQNILINILLFSSIAMLIFSILISIFSVIPRFGDVKKKDPPPLAYYRYIAKNIEDGDELINTIGNLRKESILELLIKDAYSLALIANKKMVSNKYAILLLALSLFSVLGLLIFILFFIKDNWKKID